MIRIATGQDGNDLFVQVDGKGPLDGLTFNFRLRCASNVERRLMDYQLRKQLRERMGEIRRVSYTMGWREAKGKKSRKREYFAECAEILDWEQREAGL